MLVDFPVDIKIQIGHYHQRSNDQNRIDPELALEMRLKWVRVA